MKDDVINKRLIVTSDEVRGNAVALIASLPLDPQYLIIIKPNKETLSDRQRRTYFEWVGIMAVYFKYTKDQLHQALKGQYLLPIIIRNPDDYPEICELVEDVRTVRAAGMMAEADRIARRVAQLVSLADTKTNHVYEYMVEVKALAIDNNINLPMPGDERYERTKKSVAGD